MPLRRMPLGDPLGLGEALDRVTNLLLLVEHRALYKRTVVDEEDGVAGRLANQVFTGGVEDPVDWCFGRYDVIPVVLAAR